MSEKNVRLFIVGDGDPELQSLIEAGLSELGRACEITSVAAGPAMILDALGEGEVPVVIKPA